MNRSTSISVLVRLQAMKLPNLDRDEADMTKLRNYCLSTTHKRGRNKARVFAAALGLTASGADVLRDT